MFMQRIDGKKEKKKERPTELRRNKPNLKEMYRSVYDSKMADDMYRFLAISMRMRTLKEKFNKYSIIEFEVLIVEKLVEHRVCHE